MPTTQERRRGLAKFVLAASLVAGRPAAGDTPGDAIDTDPGAAPGRASTSEIRVATYNILNYPSAQGDEREDDLRLVLEGIGPDVLIVQEVTSEAGANEFLGDVLDPLEPGAWACAPFVNGPDSDNACFYRTPQVTFLAEETLRTDLRDINGYVFLGGEPSLGEVEFRVYSLHLKASQGTDNEYRRLQEAMVLRSYLNGLPAGTNVLVGGDFNIYTSSEPAWDELTGSEVDDDGRLYDPADRMGNWHDNPAFADVHTQSTRATQLPDGGSYGGLDDRFDMLLVNDDLLDGIGLDYVDGSYVPYGNDGQHFDVAITADPPNGAVSSLVAAALQAASDHLPVYVDLEVEGTGVDEFGPVVALSQLHPSAPNPFASRTTVAFDSEQRGWAALQVFDLRGRLVRTLVASIVEPGEHRVVWDGTTGDGVPVASGVYFCRLRTGGAEQTRRMVLIR